MYNHKEYMKEYRLRNKEKIREYYIKNVEKIKELNKRYCTNNKSKFSEYQKSWVKRNVSSWEGFIPQESLCQICGATVRFNRQDPQKSMCFDHRGGGEELIKSSPFDWLRKHKRNSKNESVWISCNFGILCNRCNRILPTKDRKKFLKQVINYVSSARHQIGREKWH